MHRVWSLEVIADSREAAGGGGRGARARLQAERDVKVPTIARLAPRIGERFLAMVDQLEERLGQDPERSRPALIEAIGERIVLKPDASRRFLWAE
ncbi:MAG: hypothetical protein ACREVO_11595 [Steroidobacteraceae bacterium]